MVSLIWVFCDFVFLFFCISVLVIRIIVVIKLNLEVNEIVFLCIIFGGRIIFFRLNLIFWVLFDLVFVCFNWIMYLVLKFMFLCMISWLSFFYWGVNCRFFGIYLVFDFIFDFFFNFG